MKRTKQQILKDIKYLEDKCRKELQQTGAKFDKALKNLDKAEDRESREHQGDAKKNYSIFIKYDKLRKERLAKWHKARKAVLQKYDPKIEKLYKELEKL